VGSVAFTIVVPGTVVGLMPWLLARWFPQPALPGELRWLGLVLVVPGVAVLLDSVVRFVRVRGTPAPPAPTEELVVTGLYRFVRNPMYVGVLIALVGEALLYARAVILIYAAVAWLAVHLFVLGYEEPTLRRRYGSSYEEYTRRVRRWIPTRPRAEHTVDAS
jgi:protein-S-isoprenylcysteine O-methyltransferase Ste14